MAKKKVFLTDPLAQNKILIASKIGMPIALDPIGSSIGRLRINGKNLGLVRFTESPIGAYSEGWTSNKVKKSEPIIIDDEDS